VKKLPGTLDQAVEHFLGKGYRRATSDEDLYYRNTAMLTKPKRHIIFLRVEDGQLYGERSE
jgi:hypothetical protein